MYRSYLQFRNEQKLRYQDALDSAPSTGQGFHQYLMKIVNHGVLAGLSDKRMLRDIRAIVRGSRYVPDLEIMDTIRKARIDLDPDNATTFAKSTRPSLNRDSIRPREQRIATLERSTRDYTGINEGDIAKSSQITPTGDPIRDASLILEHLYQPEDVLFIGERTQAGTPGKTIRAAAEWSDYFKWLKVIHLPFIIPNPLSGRAGVTRSGSNTFRGDSCVCNFNVAVVEFDDIPRDLQLAFLASVDLPICALIDSGGKSIHAWVRVDGVQDEESWNRTVRENLFGEYLIPLGADPACQNQSRLSRMLGHFRREKQRYQSLLYLAPEGRRILV